MAAAIGCLDFVHSRTRDRPAGRPCGRRSAWRCVLEDLRTWPPPEAEVKRLIIEALRPQRFFDGQGYFFVDDRRGTCILLPIAPALEEHPCGTS